MDLEAILITLMISTGALFLFYGIINSIKIRKKVHTSLKFKWNIITGLMLIFLCSYLISIFIVFLEFNIILLTGFVFLGGAIFVAIIISLSSKTIYSMVEKEKLEKLNKKLEHHNEFLNNTIESLTHPFYVIDVNTYRLIMANSAARLGNLGNESTCYALTHKRDEPCGSKEHVCPLEEVKKTRQPVTVEHIHYDKDDNPRDVDVHAYPIFDKEGSLIEMIEYSIDITEKKKMQKALEHSNKELDKLLHQKDDFINQLGHDLKNPLTPITRLLPKIIRDSDDPKALERLEIINRNVEYIRNLVLRTLKLAKLNSSKIIFDFQNYNLWDISNEAIEDNKLSIDEKNISVVNNIDKNFFANIDNIQMKEVFNNLISNALKYMEKDGSITINAVLKDDFITISIEDTGVGMDKKLLSHLFDEFYKADESRHDFYSTGLGLTIAKRIIEHHGGNIWAESLGVGRGTTIYFKIPSAKEINDKDNLEIKINQ